MSNFAIIFHPIVAISLLKSEASYVFAEFEIKNTH